MRVVKPSWVCGGEALFTVDVHPDGLKFATGGQGADTGNGRIVIWYMQPVKSSKSENSCSNKQIACLDHHQGCVNCVRWSCSGHLLASASDDKVVMLWQTVRYEGSTSESYKCQHILRGHDGDVLDLAWSHDDLKLASSSIDNTVIVWDGTNFPEKLTRIRGHDGMVKGVVWDPIGRYLASQSTDRTLRVWRSSDWKEEGQVTEPFKNCGGTTTVLRLGWSPDGQYIVSSHAMNNEGPVAKIIEREDWKARMDFVGHRRAIESVRFNPHLFHYKATNSPASCVAIAGRDCSVSVWLTALKRPLFVLHDVFSSSVLDMSWTPDGYGLIACSLDGSVVYIELSSKDLGKTLSHSQTEDIKMRAYGKVVTEKASTIIENPELMDLPQTNGMSQSTSPEKSNSSFQTEEDDETMDTTPSPPPSANSNGFSSKPATEKDVKKSMEIKRQQVETKTKDGKRRIMPVTLKVVATPVKVPTIRKILPVEVEKCQAPESAFKSSSTIQFGSREEPSISMMKVPTKLSKRMRTDPPASSPALNNFTVARQKVSSVEIQDKLFTSTKDHQIEICNTSRTISCRGANSWSSALCTRATSLSAHNGVIIVGCSEGGVHVLSLSGERLLPILNVGDSVLRTAISEQSVAVISAAPSLWLWDFKKKTNLIKAENLACFISDSCSITQLKVEGCGGVVLGLSNGTAYTYSQDLKSWLLLNSNDTDSKWLDADNSLLNSLTSVSSTAGGSKEGEVKLRTIMMLEQQVMIAESLNSNKEGRQWICSLVRYLTNSADEVRLKSLFQKYISSSSDTVLGFPRMDVINELLNIVRDNVELQRLYGEVKQQLVWLESRQ